MLEGITLIILGILAAPSLLLSKRADAKELLDKIAPYQGWIGLVFCFLGLWGIFSAILRSGMLTHYPIWWITWFIKSIVEAALGFLLGYGIINQYLLSKNDDAQEKGAQLLEKLAPLQGKLGLIAIIIGIWTIFASILFHA